MPLIGKDQARCHPPNKATYLLEKKNQREEEGVSRESSSSGSVKVVGMDPFDPFYRLLGSPEAESMMTWGERFLAVVYCGTVR
jgi:hypothetical protein